MQARNDFKRLTDSLGFQEYCASMTRDGEKSIEGIQEFGESIVFALHLDPESLIPRGPQSSEDLQRYNTCHPVMVRLTVSPDVPDTFWLQAGS